MECVVNKEELLNRVGYDAELLQEVIDLFYAEYPSHIKKIRAALHDNNAEKVANAAHTLKGSLSNFACPSAFDTAYALERTGKNNRLDQTEAAIVKLDEEVNQLRPVLETIQKELSS